MKTPYSLSILIASSLLFMPSREVSAQVAIDFVAVGDIGNAADSATGGLYGSVGYDYSIGKYEVTNAQYTAFLNAVATTADSYSLYNASMGGIARSESGGIYSYSTTDGNANKPVNFVSIYDAARFVNWLTNGQGGGGTEAGAYNLSAGGAAARLTRMEAGSGVSVQYFIASEDEWYKAAYYDPTLNDGAGGYWAYPTQSNTAPSRMAPYSGPNRANYGAYANAILDVGTYTGSASYYGTFDQEGNISEFTETLSPSGSNRIRRGSSYLNYTTGSGQRLADTLATEAGAHGFRIVAVQVIPEPSAVLLLGGGALALAFAGWRKRGHRV